MRPLTLLLGQIIAASGPKRIPARVTWPMHTALHELWADAGRLGLVGRLPVDLVFVPAPEAGHRASGADEAVGELVRNGLLSRIGVLGDAALEVEAARLVDFRRALMTLEPDVVGLLQRAGSRWAALALTAEKKSRTARTSPGSIVASGTTRRQDAEPALW
jgi:hypothetical protein